MVWVVIVSILFYSIFWLLFSVPYWMLNYLDSWNKIQIEFILIFFPKWKKRLWIGFCSVLVATLNIFWIPLNIFWMHAESILDIFYLYSGYTLNVFWIHSECILNVFWIHSECKLPIWIRSESILNFLGTFWIILI